MTLDPHHGELLSASAISPEVADARSYFSAHTKAELAKLGFGRGQQLVPALVIPQWNVLGECTHYTLRPDEPRELKGKRPKYETPTGTTQTIDVPPGIRHLLEDPETPLIITEGSRKADSAASRGMCTVSLNGVYGWRGKNSNGGKAALPDWELIALNGRRVVLAFDSDAMTKPAVHEALRRLRAFLELRQAKVVICYLPPDPSGRKVGLDDWLASNPDAGFVDVDAICRDELDQPVAEPVEDYTDIDDEPGWVVLGEVHEFLKRHVRFASPHHGVAVTAWIGHTHALDCFDFTPRLHLRSAVKRSGKSRVLEVIEQLARRAVQSANISPAVLFRMMEAEQPTLLIDEVDQLLGGDERLDAEPSPLIGLLNAGFRRGNRVYRMVGQGADMQYASFSVFGPVGLAGIGRIVDTIADRSITVNLERLPAGQTVESFRHRDVVDVTAELRRRLAAWAHRNAEKLASARPEMPDGLTDRAADIWEPVLAVADVAGGTWPDDVRVAATAMVAAHLLEDSDATLPMRLLADIHQVWPDGALRYPSKLLVEKLNGLDDAPWPDVHRGDGITTYWLAAKLRPFGISSSKFREGNATFRGYDWDSFVPVWERYGVCCLQTPPPCSQNAEHSEPAGQAERSNGDGVADVPDVPDVPDLEGRQGQFADNTSMPSRLTRNPEPAP